MILRPYNRFPSKFQHFERHCRNSSFFLVKCGFTAVALKILKTCLGAYRSLFLIEMSNAARNFSIENGAYVAGSQKSLKVGERFRLKNGKSWCLANEHFFFLRPRCNSTVATVLYRYNIDTGPGPGPWPWPGPGPWPWPLALALALALAWP